MNVSSPSNKEKLLSNGDYKILLFGFARTRKKCVKLSKIMDSNQGANQMVILINFPSSVKIVVPKTTRKNQLNGNYNNFSTKGYTDKYG